LEVNTPKIQKITLNSESLFLSGILRLDYPELQETNSFNTSYALSGLITEQESKEMRIANLSMLTVHSCMQGKSIGKSLISEAESRAKSEGNCSMIFCCVISPIDYVKPSQEQLK